MLRSAEIDDARPVAIEAKVRLGRARTTTIIEHMTLLYDRHGDLQWFAERDIPDDIVNSPWAAPSPAPRVRDGWVVDRKGGVASREVEITTRVVLPAIKRRSQAC